MFRLIYHATYDNEYQVEIKIALYCNHTIFIFVNPAIWNIRQHLKDDFYWDQDDQCSKFQNYHYCDRYHPHRSDARCQIASLSVSNASGSDHPLSISSFLQRMPQIHKNWIAQTQNCHRYINTECNKHRKCSECHNYKNAECTNTKMH